jgi:TonB family protein
MKQIQLFLTMLALCCISLAQQVPDPILRSALMPQYPPLALATRVEGEVKISFVLDTKGEVASVEVLSGHPLLREAAAAIVKSWKFELPELFRTEWRYDTSFRYHLSGRELETNEAPKLTIIVDSFHRIEVMSDAFKPDGDLSVTLPIIPISSRHASRTGRKDPPGNRGGGTCHDWNRATQHPDRRPTFDFTSQIGE